MLIIPVAVVAGGGGEGTGRPRHRGPAASPGRLSEGGPAGHGANAAGLRAHGRRRGFGGLVLPAGAYVVKGGQVRWVPAVDVTIVVLASLSLVRGACPHMGPIAAKPRPAMTPFPAYPGDGRAVPPGTG